MVGQVVSAEDGVIGNQRAMEDIDSGLMRYSIITSSPFLVAPAS
jgi:hypothetical protein